MLFDPQMLKPSSQNFGLSLGTLWPWPQPQT